MKNYKINPQWSSGIFNIILIWITIFFIYVCGIEPIITTNNEEFCVVVLVSAGILLTGYQFKKMLN